MLCHQMYFKALVIKIVVTGIPKGEILIEQSQTHTYRTFTYDEKKKKKGTGNISKHWAKGISTNGATTTGQLF